jgi:hypothetical protein
MIALLLLLLLAVPNPGLGAQELNPAEPDIVLPEVVLRIEDLSVEQVQGALPGGEELPAPEREVPLPGVEQLQVAEPALPFGALGEAGDTLPAEQAYFLAAQAVLGAGSMSHVYSMISLNKVVEEPRFKLKFLHEMLDGFGGQSPGSGFHLRQDSLEGGIKQSFPALSLSAEGGVQDYEQGLQNLSPGDQYVSEVSRQGWAQGETEIPLGGLFSLGAKLEGSFASQLLTGPDSLELTELRAAPGLSLQYHQGPLRLTLEGSYAYRTLLDRPGQLLHRAGTSLALAAELSDRYRLEAQAGYLWSSALGNLFPFSLTLAGTPFAFLAFQAGGGYRVQEVDARSILNDYPLAELPGALLYDNHGWFGDLGLSFTLGRNLSLQLRALLAWNSALPVPERLDPAIDEGLGPLGLFPVSQQAATTLSTEAHLRWNLSTTTALSAGLDSELMYRSRFTPLHTGTVEFEATDAAARWGGSASLGFNVGFPPEEVTPANRLSLLLPLLGLRLFYNPADTISLVGEVDDLLYPFLDGPRYSWYPFQAPGLRGILKVQINL